MTIPLKPISDIDFDAAALSFGNLVDAINKALGFVRRKPNAEVEAAIVEAQRVYDCSVEAEKINAAADRLLCIVDGAHRYGRPTELDIIAPQKTGEVMHTGSNRRQRRGDGARAANTDLKLGPSIFQILDVKEQEGTLTGARFFEIWIRRRGVPTVMLVYTKEGQPPQIDGLLERMQRPGGGFAAIWTDARASKGSTGGGYSEEAVPVEWMP
jgi:hypothetical protein